jgi:hypothetical protein
MVGGGNDLDLSTAGSKVDNFFLKSVSETLVHGGTTGEDYVLAEVFSGIRVGGLNGSPSKGVKGMGQGNGLEIITI